MHIHALHDKSMGKAGFTLIELSIVLVIIGLIAGGILTGQDLIKQAELRRVITDVEHFNTAVYTFRSKYGGLPGDITNATSFWGTDSSCPYTPNNTVLKTATCNGNGDGQIGLYQGLAAGDSPQMYEASRFWQQLANAGLIPGSYTGVDSLSSQEGGDVAAVIGVNVPAGPISSTGYTVFGWYTQPSLSFSGYFSGSYQSVFYFGTNVANNDVTNEPILTPAQAHWIDAKTDDGMPGTGSIVTTDPLYAPAANCATSANAATATYNLTYTGIACCLIFLNKY